MPQIILEHSSNVSSEISYKEIFKEIHLVLTTVPGVQIKKCKSRVKIYEDYLVGEGTSTEAFVAAQIKIIEGRDKEVKQKLGADVLEILKGAFKTLENPSNTQISIEIAEVSRDFYFRS